MAALRNQIPHFGHAAPSAAPLPSPRWRSSKSRMMLPSGVSGGDDTDAVTTDATEVTAGDAGDAASTADEDEDVVARTRALSETLRGFERPRIPIEEGSRLHFRELLPVLLPMLPLRDESLLPKPLLVEEPLLLVVLLWRM